MNSNRGRMAGVAWAMGVLCVSSSAWADTIGFPAAAAPPAEQSAPPAPAAVPSASAEVVENPAWSAAYARARSAMAQGQFGLAASSFADLAQNARTPEKRALCAELEGLAKQWAGAGLMLKQPEERNAAPLGGAQPNERTTDEISVLYLNSVVYGLGSGVWLATLSEPQDAAGIILPALGLAGAAAGAVALVDHSSHLGYGVPASAVTGLYVGLEEGITWSLWNQARSPYFNEWQGKTVATVIWGAATAGAITGAAVGAVAGTTPGRASYVGSTALWGGLLSGFLTASVTADDRGQRDDAGLLGAAIGTNLGAIAGVVSAGALSPSVARVRFMDLGGIGGGLLAGGLYVSAANDLSGNNVQGFFGVTALGMAGGLALSAVLTQGMPADRGVTTDAPPRALSLEPTLIPVRGGTLLGAAGTF